VCGMYVPAERQQVAPETSGGKQSRRGRTVGFFQRG